MLYEKAVCMKRILLNPMGAYGMLRCARGCAEFFLNFVQIYIFYFFNTMAFLPYCPLWRCVEVCEMRRVRGAQGGEFNELYEF